ncbi:alpha/beta fold hydrolase [Clostridium sp. YIM B02555]|uniref:alpha/beta hydrolase family protein n=1 Tax=Clostridium sp. YIM B02555 TaxID=2911968 RepID=UPI001EEED785|nr:alpha/beta fold hydrolase [Clostridium sp. YIM B02555]
MGFLFKNKHFDYQALRTLGTTPVGQADISEVTATSQKIKNGSCSSWCTEWEKTADRVRKFGEECLKEGLETSASESFLRASNYYRTAEFYLNYGSNKEYMDKINTLSTQCFNLAIKYGPYHIEPVEIPFEGISLPGHFYHADTKGPAPTIIVISGNDGTKEELYAIGIAAIKRGMNCLAFDGPGQGESIRRRNIPFRYNYETAISPAVDFVLKDLSVDHDRIILWGESLGGYFAPRAAAFEKRISACIANGGLYDCLSLNPKKREATLNKIHKHATTFNLISRMLMKMSVALDWRFRHGFLTFGVDTPAEYVLSYKNFCLDGVTSKISCPVLVIGNESDKKAWNTQSKILYDKLECPKDYLFFTNNEGAGYHCQVGCRIYANDRIFNWIEKTIATI